MVDAPHATSCCSVQIHSTHSHVNTRRHTRLLALVILFQTQLANNQAPIRTATRRLHSGTQAANTLNRNPHISARSVHPGTNNAASYLKATEVRATISSHLTQQAIDRSMPSTPEFVLRCSKHTIANQTQSYSSRSRSIHP